MVEAISESTKAPIFDMTSSEPSVVEDFVNVPRVKYGNRQTIDTLISEEDRLLARYLRNERQDWTLRIPPV